MPEPKKTPTPAAPMNGASQPQSRVRIKPQGTAAMDRETVRDAVANTLREAAMPAVDALLAQAEAEQWPRERIVEGMLAIQREVVKDVMSPEDVEDVERQARDMLLGRKV